MKKVIFASVFVLAILLSASTVFAGNGPGVFTQFNNPRILFVVLLQVALGFGLGYFAVKALKYVFAIGAILVLGTILQVWNFGGIQNMLQETVGVKELAPLEVVKAVASALGVLVVLPVGIGFLLGVIIGIVTSLSSLKEKREKETVD